MLEYEYSIAKSLNSHKGFTILTEGFLIKTDSNDVFYRVHKVNGEFIIDKLQLDVDNHLVDCEKFTIENVPHDFFSNGYIDIVFDNLTTNSLIEKYLSNSYELAMKNDLSWIIFKYDGTTYTSYFLGVAVAKAILDMKD